jgi:hypothetical protein
MHAHDDDDDDDDGDDVYGQRQMATRRRRANKASKAQARTEQAAINELFYAHVLSMGFFVIQALVFAVSASSRPVPLLRTTASNDFDPSSSDSNGDVNSESLARDYGVVVNFHIVMELSVSSLVTLYSITAATHHLLIVMRFEHYSKCIASSFNPYRWAEVSKLTQ